MKYSISTLALLMAALLVLPSCRASRGCCCPPPCGEVVEVMEEETVPSVVGTWDVDMAIYKADLEKLAEEQLKQMPEAQAAAMKDMFTKFIAGIDESSITVEMKADGTWEAKMTLPKMPSGEIGQWSEFGTWKLEGNEFTLTTDTRDGKPVDKPVPGKGTLDGDTLRSRSEGSPFDMVMHRRK